MIRVGPAPRLAVDVVGGAGGAGRAGADLVVLLHGIGGNRTNWSDQLPALAPWFTAAALDCRGYGDSDDVDGAVTMDDLVGDVVRVIDHLGAERAHLVGLSLGGMIAMATYQAAPERVRSLVLCDTGVGPRHDFDDEGLATFLERRRQPLLEGRQPADFAPALAATLASPDAVEGSFDRLVASLSVLRPTPYLAMIEMTTTYGGLVDLESYDVPTLVVVGEDDQLTPPASARTLSERIPGAKLEIIPGAGHLSNIEQPARFNTVVVDFLRSLHHAA